MKKIHLIISGGVVAIMSLVIYFIFVNSAYTTADFAECLSDADIVMYGTDQCKYCSEQKKMFDEAFSKVNFVNCDFNVEECDEAGVEFYPTWKIGNEFLGNLGIKTFLELATASGCNLPSE